MVHGLAAAAGTQERGWVWRRRGRRRKRRVGRAVPAAARAASLCLPLAAEGALPRPAGGSARAAARPAYRLASQGPPAPGCDSLTTCPAQIEGAPPRPRPPGRRVQVPPSAERALWTGGGGRPLSCAGLRCACFARGRAKADLLGASGLKPGWLAGVGAPQALALQTFLSPLRVAPHGCESPLAQSAAGSRPGSRSVHTHTPAAPPWTLRRCCAAKTDRVSQGCVVGGRKRKPLQKRAFARAPPRVCGGGGPGESLPALLAIQPQPRPPWGSGAILWRGLQEAAIRWLAAHHSPVQRSAPAPGKEAACPGQALSQGRVGHRWQERGALADRAPAGVRPPLLTQPLPSTRSREAAEMGGAPAGGGRGPRLRGRYKGCSWSAGTGASLGPAKMPLTAADKANVKAIWAHVAGRGEAFGTEILVR